MRRGSPADVVSSLVAVQSQDYGGATWSVAQRCGATSEKVERAFNDGSILRTHMLRPTWHFCAPADIRWLLMLTGPRVDRANKGRYRQLGLDAATLRRSRAVFAKALAGGRTLTRDELREAIAGAGIGTADQRMAHMLMNAELNGLICSGPRRGKQFTYALLEERVPPVKARSREEALEELAQRYFDTRGPASVQDFAKWSGLTVADCSAGLEAVCRHLERHAIGKRVLWFAPRPAPRGRATTAHLLSIYDEYISSYRQRDEIGDPRDASRLVGMGAALQFVFLVNGMIAGTWRRDIGSHGVAIELHPFRPLRRGELDAVRTAADRYGRFLRLPVRLAKR